MYSTNDMLKKKVILLIFIVTTVGLSQSNSNMLLRQSFESDIEKTPEFSISGAKIIGEKNNKVAFFDGVDDFISVKVPHLNSDNDFSISIWIAPSRYKIASSWVSKSNYNTSKSQFRFGFGWPANKKLGFTFYDNFWQDENIKSQLPLYEWTHLVYTLSPKNKKGQLYINGTLKHEYELKQYRTSLDPIFLGLQWDDYIFYHGYLDEFILFKEVISKEEIKKLYNNFLKTPKLNVKSTLSSKKKEYTYSIPKKRNDKITTGNILDINCQYDSIFSIVENQLNAPFANLESLLIYKGNKLVLEEYFHGYTVNSLHGVSSVTKSFASTLLGIAIDNEFIKSENTSLTSYYSEKINNNISCVDSITLKHILNHKSGIKPVEVAQNYRTKEAWVSNLLLGQTECNIGTFKYHELNPELIIHTVFSKSINKGLDFVEKYLFKPLGIKNYYWLKDQTGTIDGGTGLVMLPRDMLKFGILYKDKGMFLGKRVLSEAWVKKATGKEVTDYKYNYYWWRFNLKIKGHNVYGYRASGFGGQNITIVPMLDLVVVTTNSPSGGGLTSNAIIENTIIPAFLN